MIKKIQERIDNFKGTDEKDKIKFEHIIKNMGAISSNHLKNIDTLPKQKWCRSLLVQKLEQFWQTPQKEPSASR